MAKTFEELRREILKNKVMKDQIKSAVAEDLHRYEAYFLDMSDDQLVEEVKRNPEAFRNLLRYVYNDTVIDMLEADLAELNE